MLSPLDRVFFSSSRHEGGKTRLRTFSGSQETTVKAGLGLPSNTTDTLGTCSGFRQSRFCPASQPLSCRR